MTQPTDIVERLERFHEHHSIGGTLIIEAAAEITRLRGQEKRVQSAEAHTRGVKAGLEAAARVADGEADAADLTWKEFCDPHDQGRWFGADQVATAIRAIDPTTVEAQK